MSQKDLYLIGYASALGGPSPKGAEGPLVLQQSPYLKNLNPQKLHWGPQLIAQAAPDTITAIADLCQTLAGLVAACVKENKFFLVLGGDHTSAIGTWSGACHGADRGPLGLIWIDAHMDSHTPETTPSGNVHGMPLASLLGSGPAMLTDIAFKGAKIQPENLCLIGARSFEPEEEAFLQQRHVRIFYMDEVKAKGLDQVIREAIQHVSQRTKCFGFSIDIDSIDPADAPGTGVPEPNGLSGIEIVHMLKGLQLGAEWIGVEIVEFDPSRDQSHRTEQLIAQMISALLGP